MSKTRLLEMMEFFLWAQCGWTSSPCEHIWNTIKFTWLRGRPSPYPVLSQAALFTAKKQDKGNDGMGTSRAQCGWMLPHTLEHNESYLAEGMACKEGAHVQVVPREEEQLCDGPWLGFLGSDGLPLHTGHHDARQPQQHLTRHQQQKFISVVE